MTVTGVLHDAIAAQKQERFWDAEKLCRSVLAASPHDLPALHLLAINTAMRGNNAFAIMLLKDVLEREPASVQALNQLGVLLRADGECEGAVMACAEAARLSPTSTQTFLNLGLAHLSNNDNSAAQRAFQTVVEFDLDPVEALCHLALVQCLEQGSPKCDDLLNKVRKLSKAAVDKGAGALRFTGKSLQRQGRFRAATAALELAIELNPSQTSAYVDLAYGTRFSIQDGLIARMEKLLDSASLGAIDRANLHFALGKAYDDCSQFEPAIAHFDAANKLKSARHRFDRKKHSEAVEWVKKNCSREWCADHIGGSSSQQPIIIVGMPRSGTTLVERILSNHSRIGSGGELMFWGDTAARLVSGDLGNPMEFGNAVTEEYLRLLKSIDPAAVRTIDKMPSNFFRLGLIHKLFPHAKLIHCRRHPVDNCLSIFFTQFETGHEYANDRGDLVFYYQQYRDMMEHWRESLPAGCLIEVQYEALISSFEVTARGLIDQCGLEWETRCLHPETNRRAVHTASFWQMRQPIFTHSVSRWRNYEGWLGDFSTLLNGNMHA